MDADALRRAFGGQPTNIGIATGEASGRLVDVDLDCDEAVAAAQRLMPRTGLLSGRTSRPASHYWYTLHPAGTLQGGIPSLRFSIPASLCGGGKPAAGDAPRECVLVEIRYNGHQTIVEPSIHPSGERVHWQATDDAAEVTALALLRGAGTVAAAALLARYWPPKGTRDECALALTGALLRMGWAALEADEFVRAVAIAAGDEEWKARAKGGATAARLSANPDAPTRGWPSVGELLASPSGERVAALARVWLGYGRGSGPHASQRLSLGSGTAAPAPIERTTVSSATKVAPTAAEGAGPAWGVLVSDVAASQVSWLWPGRIPLGMITLMDGDPGLGKSLVCADLAARVTRGWPMPDSSEGADPAGVILLSNEDSLSATIRPRLEAAGADLSLIVAEQTVTETDPATGELRERPIVLPSDTAVLEGAVRRIGARLIVIDPLMSYLSANVNTWRDQDVRSALAPLARLAEKTGTAVLVLRHLNKATALANALYRGGGSIGIIGAARSALLVAQAPDNEAHRIIAVNKSNLAGPQASLRYSVDRAPGAAAPVVSWLGEASYTARTLLTGKHGEPPETAVREAESFILAQLADGPVVSSELNVRAARAGFTSTTMERARRNVKVGTFRVGFGKGSRIMAQLPYGHADVASQQAVATEHPAGPGHKPQKHEPGKHEPGKHEPGKHDAPPRHVPDVPDEKPKKPAHKRPARSATAPAPDVQEDPEEGDVLPFEVPYDDDDDDDDGGDSEADDCYDNLSDGDDTEVPTRFTAIPEGWEESGPPDADSADGDSESDHIMAPLPCTLRGEHHVYGSGNMDMSGRPVCDACGWASLVPPRATTLDRDPAA